MHKNALGVRVSGLETCKKNSRVEKGQHSPPQGPLWSEKSVGSHL